MSHHWTVQCVDSSSSDHLNNIALCKCTPPKNLSAVYIQWCCRTAVLKKAHRLKQKTRYELEQGGVGTQSSTAAIQSGFRYSREEMWDPNSTW